MIRKLLVLVFGLTVLQTAGAFTQSAETPVTQRVDFGPGGLIRLDHVLGSVKVEGWDKAEVEVTTVKSLPYEYQPKHPEIGPEHLEAVRVSAITKSDAELVISTVLPARGKDFSPSLRKTTTGGVSLNYEIHVPRDSRLIIHHDRGGYILVSGVNGDIEATCSRGDIVLMLSESGRYAIDAKSRFGTVSSDFAGATHRRLLLGQRFGYGSGTPSHRIYLRMGLGGIAIKAAPADLAPDSSGIVGERLQEDFMQ